MPKEGRARSVSSNKSRSSPYTCSSSHSKRSLPLNPLESEKNLPEWEDARCPVCMEHPHNAILLLCSSHEKGCRPYMCDTSYRHSNCFDQFRKSSSDASSTVSLPDVPTSMADSLPNMVSSGETAIGVHIDSSIEGSVSARSFTCKNEVKEKLLCPLCRGHIKGWTVVEHARRFMNAKSRSCACESCEYSGTYTDLRKHARQVHPLVRPSEADPERQRNWRRLERQMDFDDLLSSLQSTVGEERTDDGSLSIDERGWFTVFFLVRIFRPRNTSSNSLLFGSSQGRVRRAVRRRLSRRLWGETNEGESEPASREEGNALSDDESVSRHRRGRQVTSEDEE